jgi:glycosyltransferase involved in cell wall biosynthesis
MAYQKADYLVAISEYVRNSVIETAGLSPERVITVPIGLLRTPGSPVDDSSDDGVLEKYNLRHGEYILYPANFWPHKNHAMLLTAFNMYRQANPHSVLKLLCTGAPGPRAQDFCEAVRRMELSEWVIYPGYVNPNEYDSLLRSSFALVFPSLYEGFGIPVLEAMSAGVPVICSNVTSLPEVGGDAVLYFDPRRPGQIVDALIRLSEEPKLRNSLVTKGLQRARLFESAGRMAAQYIDVFAKALHVTKNEALTTSR